MSRDEILAPRNAVIEAAVYQLAAVKPLMRPFAIREAAERLDLNMSDLKAAVREATRKPRARRAYGSPVAPSNTTRDHASTVEVADAPTQDNVSVAEVAQFLRTQLLAMK